MSIYGGTRFLVSTPSVCPCPAVPRRCATRKIAKRQGRIHRTRRGRGEITPASWLAEQAAGEPR
jgi:hypothetical protein